MNIHALFLILSIVSVLFLVTGLGSNSKWSIEAYNNQYYTQEYINEATMLRPVTVPTYTEYWQSALIQHLIAIPFLIAFFATIYHELKYFITLTEQKVIIKN